MADQPVSPVPVAPAGLSRRAQRFIETEGICVRQQDIRRHHDAWIERGIPAAEIERATAFQDRWGGLALPPAPFYEGGPRILDADCPEKTPAEGWSFPAGDCRVSMAYSFMIGPDGAFGIDANRWTPLHASTDGWARRMRWSRYQWVKGVTSCR
ncbi:SMI1/KNR4 family protein OS=Streptomyces griseomycini OX=66895 GN=FHS37_007426 PE=4 SV=1 [Streptomyces griseomycini]